LIGEDRPMIEKAIQGTTTLLHAETLEEAVAFVSKIRKPMMWCYYHLHVQVLICLVVIQSADIALLHV
jgi:hypothetical protein